MEVAVNDTNIFIDIIQADLFEIFLRLPLEIHTTDMVLEEITNPEQYEIVSRACNEKKILLKVFDFEDLTRIGEILYKHGKVSMQDCGVLFYADVNNFTLITSDGPLRKIAKSTGVKVRGLLFIFNLMVKEELISIEIAKQKLNFLIDNGTRLPEIEVHRLFKSWD